MKDFSYLGDSHGGQLRLVTELVELERGMFRKEWFLSQPRKSVFVRHNGIVRNLFPDIYDLRLELVKHLNEIRNCLVV